MNTTKTTDLLSNGVIPHWLYLVHYANLKLFNLSLPIPMHALDKITDFIQLSLRFILDLNKTQFFLICELYTWLEIDSACKTKQSFPDTKGSSIHITATIS